VKISPKLRNAIANVWSTYSSIVYGEPTKRRIFAGDFLHVRLIYRFVNEFLFSLSKGQYVLDVGCGDKRYQNSLPKGVRYVGLDYAATKKNFINEYPIRIFLAIYKQFRLSLTALIVFYVQRY
jgi:hypothetical protein